MVFKILLTFGLKVSGTGTQLGIFVYNLSYLSRQVGVAARLLKALSFLIQVVNSGLLGTNVQLENLLKQTWHWIMFHHFSIQISMTLQVEQITVYSYHQLIYRRTISTILHKSQLYRDLVLRKLNFCLNFFC